MFQRTRTSKDRLESSATTKDDAAATTTSILQTMGCQAQLGEALLSSDGSVARRLLALTFSRGPYYALAYRLRVRLLRYVERSTLR